MGDVGVSLKPKFPNPIVVDLSLDIKVNGQSVVVNPVRMGWIFFF